VHPSSILPTLGAQGLQKLFVARADIVALGSRNVPCVAVTASETEQQHLPLNELPFLQFDWEARGLTVMGNMHTASALFVASRHGAQTLKEMAFFCMATSRSVGACMSFIHPHALVLGPAPPPMTFVSVFSVHTSSTFQCSEPATQGHHRWLKAGHQDRVRGMVFARQG